MAEQRRVTLRRIAEEVGVSPMTVSNAFNRPDQLSPALRERILERARQLAIPAPTRWRAGCAAAAPAQSA